MKQTNAISFEAGDTVFAKLCDDVVVLHGGLGRCASVSIDLAVLGDVVKVLSRFDRSRPTAAVELPVDGSVA